MNEPTFLVIGAAKCGTTSACDLLSAHPSVFMTTPKEPHYFSRLIKYHQQKHRYRSLFPGEGDTGYEGAGEGSTSYTHPHRIDLVVPRIRSCLPDCRLIYMVRHPVRRLESDWKMRLLEGRVPSSIVKAVDQHISLITFGLYWKHVQAYRKAFPDEQLLIVFLEDFAAKPVQELSRMYRHIGVDPSFVPDTPNRRRNTSANYRRKKPLADLLVQIPGFSQVKKIVPTGLAKKARLLLTDDFDPSIEWDPSSLEIVHDYFRQDAKQLLRYCGKSPTFWEL